MKQNPLDSAVECLRQIAALSRRQASDLAKNWLATHGYAREEGGYVAGKGFESPQDCSPQAYYEFSTIDTALKDSSSPQSIPITGLTD